MGKFSDAIRLPSAKFPEVGAAVSGIVVDIFDADIPHFEKDGKINGVEVDAEGNALQQVDVTVETLEGKVTVHTNGAIYYAIGRALAEVGSEDLELGDTLTVTYTGDGPKKAGRNAPKQYAAVIAKA